MRMIIIFSWQHNFNYKRYLISFLQLPAWPPSPQPAKPASEFATQPLASIGPGKFRRQQ
jgi:hypothetical protein